METKQELLVAGFREILDLFSFFHLGSDAIISINQEADGIHVRISHRRVSPLEFALSWEEIREMMADRTRFEDFMLGWLTRNRVS